MADNESERDQSGRTSVPRTGRRRPEPLPGEGDRPIDPDAVSSHTRPRATAQRANPPAFNIPVVLVVLVALMAAVHAFVSGASDERWIWTMINFAVVPIRFDSAFSGMVGGLNDMLIAGPDSHWFTLVTYGFLHGDWLHLGINALWLVTFGAPVARRLGNGRFLALLAAGFVAGAATHLLFHWGEAAPLVGASAGVSAVMGGAARFVFTGGGAGMMRMAQDPDLVRHTPLSPLSVALRSPSVIAFAGIWIATNVLFGAAASMPGVQDGAQIAWQAHLGGFALGFLLFSLFDRRA